MLDWKILAIIGPLSYALFGTFSKLLPKSASVFLVNTYAYLFGSVFMLVLHMLLSQNKSLSLSSKSLFLALGIGGMLSLGTLSVIKAYNLGAPQSIFSIVSYVILIIYGVLFGILFFQEKLSLPQVFGAILSIAGVLIIVYYKK